MSVDAVTGDCDQEERSAARRTFQRSKHRRSHVAGAGRRLGSHHLGDVIDVGAILNEQTDELEVARGTGEHQGRAAELHDNIGLTVRRG